MRVLHQLARFVATKHHVEFFGELLQQQGLPAAMVYGTMDQTARQEQANQPKWRGNPSVLSISTHIVLGLKRNVQNIIITINKQIIKRWICDLDN